MAKSSQHVIPNPNGGWSVKKGGASKATKRFDTQEQAITFAREVSRNQGSEMYVHRRDGTIRSKDSFANDPFPPKG